MLRLFLGAAIQNILSKRLDVSVLPLVSFVGSENIAGPWTANAGPSGGLGKPGRLCTNQRENIFWIILLPHPIHFTLRKWLLSYVCMSSMLKILQLGRNYKFFFPAVSHVTILLQSSFIFLS